MVLAFAVVRTGVADPLKFDLSLKDSTNLIFTTTPVLSVITVGNQIVGSPQNYVANVYVTNTFSAPVLFTGVSNDYTTNYTAGTNLFYVGFAFQNFSNFSVANLGYIWRPLTAGPITSRIVVTTSNPLNITTLTTNYYVYSVQADLGTSLALISQAYVTNDFWVVTNDWVTFQATVTNLGPVSVSGVLLTNSLPPGVSLVASGNSGYTTSSNSFVYSVGTLASGASASYQFTIQATNVGAFALTSSVGAPGLYDSNATNNVAGANLFATNYLAGPLLAVTNSGQTVDYQNGLLEQNVLVTNAGTNSVPAFRLIVSGLTNQLFNASGTNSGGGKGLNPFVAYPGQLTANGTLNLRLQYAPRLPFPFTNGQLHAYAVPASVLYYTPQPASRTLTNNSPSFYLIKPLANGDVLLEFTNLSGSAASYNIEYSDNLQFSNALLSLPAFSSPANRIQWLDYGPPATISAPQNNAGSRYYKVILNP